jgi:hypothetical protein
MADDIVVGKVGRVTGQVAPNTLGEIIIPIRNGSEHFMARASGPWVLPIGAEIVVTDYFPPRTVTVKPLTAS